MRLTIAVMCVITGLFLSLFGAAEANGNAPTKHYTTQLYDNHLRKCIRNCNPNVRMVRVTPAKDNFASKKEPVPYAGLDWARTFNPWHDLHMTYIESFDSTPKPR